MASVVIRKAWFSRPSNPGTAQVPATTNPTPEATFLAGLRPFLVAGVRTPATHATILAGNIISSTPVAGTSQTIGTSVAYSVSTGP